MLARARESDETALAADMPRAIAAGEIILHHQPRLDIRTGAVCGVEALARWRHPRRGLLSPDVFIAPAERAGHIAALSESVIRRALEDQRTMMRGGQPVEVSINLSGSLLSAPGFLDRAVTLGADAQGPLAFEISERALVAESEAGLAGISRLREAGFGVAIDNVGAGLSSLALLAQARADTLKVDRRLILALANEPKNAVVVRALVDLAHGLGLRATAEGVETNEAFSLLARMGCDFAQGFLIERPMPLEDALAFLREFRAAPRRYG